MTPAPTSGSQPDSQNLTVKQQRQVQRDKKLEAFRNEQKRSVRNRKIGISVAIVAAVAVVGLVVASVVLTPQKATYTAGGGTGAKIEGVETFTNGAGHVETTVNYPQTPPAGGEHNPMWLNCGVYTEPVPNENAVHALEHGAIWVTYDKSLSSADLDTLKTKLPSTYTVLSPFTDIPSPIVLSAWNAQLKVDKADDPRIEKFFQEYWKSSSVPEPGAYCTGAFDAPGKVS
jgi:hypothetical protein